MKSAIGAPQPEPSEPSQMLRVKRGLMAVARFHAMDNATRVLLGEAIGLLDRAETTIAALASRAEGASETAAGQPVATKERRAATEGGTSLQPGAPEQDGKKEPV